MGMPFDDALAAAGFATHAEFADYVHAHKDTVNRWRCGRQEIPRWIELILGLRQRLIAVE